MLQDILDPAARRVIYVIYAVIGLAVGATQVGYSSAEVGQPVWLTVTLAVFAFVGTAFGFTASANTPREAGRHVATAVAASADEVECDGEGCA